MTKGVFWEPLGDIMNPSDFLGAPSMGPSFLRGCDSWARVCFEKGGLCYWHTGILQGFRRQGPILGDHMPYLESKTPIYDQLFPKQTFVSCNGPSLKGVVV